MAGRYDNQVVSINDNENYKKIFRDRGVNFIRMFRTQVLKHPTTEEIADLDIIGHIWKTGDRFYKLAHEHYGDVDLWYVIAHYNQKPTEAHINVGDVIYIPFPLNKVLQILGY